MSTLSDNYCAAMFRALMDGERSIEFTFDSNGGDIGKEIFACDQAITRMSNIVDTYTSESWVNGQRTIVINFTEKAMTVVAMINL